jgi:Ni2+-binding GTPase involved in maturation of urease and hydrogenase
MNQEYKPWIVLVGGFLASGKTTLILAAARELGSRGLRCAALFNDQGHDLVDSRYAESIGMRTGEVEGGCFCCRFSDLVDQVRQLRAFAPDVVFAEPVGSCTDRAATVLRPLRELRWEAGTGFRLAPLTVLVDPERARTLLGAGGDISMRFLFEKQMQEADLVCFTKSDLYPVTPELNLPHFRQLSAKSGKGVKEWIDEVMGGTTLAGERPLEIDYEEYAKAEASLAWLNLTADLRLHKAQSPAMLLGQLFEDLDRELDSKDIPIAHMKVIVSGPTGFLKAAIAGHGKGPELEGNLDASPANELELLLNLRASGDPEIVRDLVERRMSWFGDQIAHLEVACFRPGAPVPERRIDAGAARLVKMPSAGESPGS